MIQINNKLWLISDTHFGHKNIIKYGARPESHETMMIAEWIRLVRPEDQILHLGDVFFNNREKWKTIIRWLPGEKFLILGNHDKEGEQYYLDCGFTVIDPFIDNAGTPQNPNIIAFTHHPETAIRQQVEHKGWHVNIHGHIHNNGYSLEHDGELYPYKQYINLSIEEVEGYRPVQLGNVLQKGGKLGSEINIRRA